MRVKFLSIITILSSFFFSCYLSAEIDPFRGLEKLLLPNKMVLTVITDKDFDFLDKQGARRYWKTTIALKKDGKVVWQRIYHEINSPDRVYGNIVPIRKNQYFTDLDNDGFNEVAILFWDFGMSVYKTAEIYSIKADEISFFGKGKFNFEFGPNILLGCPLCSKFNERVCRSCR